MEISRLLSEAQNLARRGLFAKATRLCDQALEQDSNNVATNHLLARVFDAQGQYDKALEQLAKVLSLNPSDLEVSIEYGRALRLTKNLVDAAKHLHVIYTRSTSYSLCLEYGLVLYELEQFDDAIPVFNNSLALKPDCEKSNGIIANILIKQGHLKQAIPHLEKVLEITGDSAIRSKVNILKIRNQINEGDSTGAISGCDQLLEANQIPTEVLAHKVTALSESNDISGMDFLSNFTDFIKRIPAVCPASFANIEDFNAYLTHYLLNQQSMIDKKTMAERYSTINGQQTGADELFNNNSSLGNTIREMMATAFDTYIEDLPDLPDHPFISSQPNERFLEHWSVILHHQGHQKSHIHPTSWLSGCYYIQLPDDFDDQPEPTAGHLEFGRPPETYQIRNEPKTYMLKPVIGEFVIFPSYFWHRTIPLLSHQPRICIAFDWSAIKAGIKV